ncbi:hypothetical protein BU15DRAFT_60091 [Melanogaster broomeanus]|nr:hypothetical protein BU15DRAFT_60091 [Melanogaster broomeanus]
MHAHVVKTPIPEGDSWGNQTTTTDHHGAITIQLISHNGLSWLDQHFIVRRFPSMDNTFPIASDFIIVGGGTAGLVLARRLSEAGHSVHVLEAGRKIESLRAEDPATPFDQTGKLDLETAVSMPVFATAVLGTGEIAWRNLAECGDHKVRMPSGRVLGGSSILNIALWTRGDAADYDLIADMNNDPSWKFDSLKKYFRKSETFHPDPSTPFDRENYGDDGPIHVVPVSASRRGYGLSEYARRAYEAADFRYNGYGNDGNSLGFSVLGQSNYPLNGGRQSSMKYIENVGAARLHISELQIVASIIIEGKKAIGVRTVDGTTYKASKEVLVCAGGLRSPAILQHSGIGDESHLKQHGIPVVHHLPGVGQNLWDHPVLVLKWSLQDKYAKCTLDGLRSDPKRMSKELTKYNLKQGGLFEGPTDSNSAHGKTTPGRVRRPLTRTSPHECDPKWLSTEVDRTIMKEALKTANEVVTKMVDEEGSPVAVEEVDFGRDPPALGFDEEDLERSSGPHRPTRLAAVPWRLSEARVRYRWLTQIARFMASRACASSMQACSLSRISANTQAPVYALAEKIADAILREHSFSRSQSKL